MNWLMEILTGLFSQTCSAVFLYKCSLRFMAGVALYVTYSIDEELLDPDVVVYKHAWVGMIILGSFCTW